MVVSRWWTPHEAPFPLDLTHSEKKRDMGWARNASVRFGQFLAAKGPSLLELCELVAGAEWQ